MLTYWQLVRLCQRKQTGTDQDKLLNFLLKHALLESKRSILMEKARQMGFSQLTGSLLARINEANIHSGKH